MYFGFLSLRKNWLCLAEIFMFSLPGKGGGVAPIFILGGELLALMPVLFGKITCMFPLPYSTAEEGTVTRNSRGGDAWKTGARTTCW